jgi:hypothetical protein
MIPDRTGRFKQRPYWEAAELDQQCEEAITAFLRQRYGFERIPVPTEALTEIIERDASELDLKPNLSDDQHEVFGYAEFECGKRPRVIIARELWERRYRNNRLRMTLGHEYGHVLLHTSFTTSMVRWSGRSVVTGRICCPPSGWLTGLNGRPATPAAHC